MSERLIESGIPTEAFVALVAVSKYVDHLPLCQRPQTYARQRVDHDQSTSANWTVRAAFAPRPVQ